ncbi:hypothetical protein MINTM005_13540 [Mycobacterium intracellulare]|nr:hypothetical protein MINTM005_13540 [Mycobacterium intracellulare]
MPYDSGVCDELGCEHTTATHRLFRVNPRGEPGIFKCVDHGGRQTVSRISPPSYPD